MADNKKKNLPPEAQKYQAFQKERETKRPLFKNCLKAFFVGGFICFIGQFFLTFFKTFLIFQNKQRVTPTFQILFFFPFFQLVFEFIFITMLLTGFGVYDKIAQFAGAGTAVPVTGFGNSVISSAIEHRPEGFVLGVGGNMFKLAGSVILFGVFSAFIIAFIKTLLIQ